MICQLCDAINEDYRIIKKTKYSFVVICKWPLKEGHILIMPKRHVTQNNFSQLSPEEVYDLFVLVEEMQFSMNEFSSEEVILFKNSGKHSSEIHFHFHLLPSKGPLRGLFSKYENIPYKVDISKEDYSLMQKKILKFMK